MERRVAGVFLIAAPFIGDGGWPSEDLRPTRQVALELHGSAPLYFYQGRDDDTVPSSHIDMFADADFARGEDWRVVQFTPPGSQCSIQFGKGLSTAAPARSQGLFLVVNDIKAARAELIGRGADVSDVFHVEGGLSFSATKGRVPGPDPQGRSYFSTRHSAIRTATAGCSRRSRRGSPDAASAWTSRR